MNREKKMREVGRTEAEGERRRMNLGRKANTDTQWEGDKELAFSKDL